jgi:NADH dehydrogenase
MHAGVLLTTGEHIATNSLIWCVGVRPDPLVADLDLPTDHGRLVVDAFLTVPGHAELMACGDCAAVPDATRPGSLTAMTAQHAQRQGALVGRNILAALSGRAPRAYRHRDLGFLVDLGGADAAADPLGIPLSGIVAKALTRGYHLSSLPGNRLRTTADWIIDAATPPRAVQLGLVRSGSVPLTTTT